MGFNTLLLLRFTNNPLFEMHKLLRSLLFVALLCYTHTATAQGVAVNTTGAVANSTAILDASSSTQGMLIPRMDSAHRMAIVSPASQLLVCQTDGISPGIYIYNGSTWQKVGANVQPHVQVYTTSGTYTFTTSANITPATLFKITLVAGGGGGGGSPGGGPGSAGGGGGGGGSNAIYWASGLSSNTGYAITIGYGGGGGPFSGSAGGNSTITIGAVTVTCTGGGGGTYATSASTPGTGGAGGTASGGTLNTGGGTGSNGTSSSGGNGGASQYGAGGPSSSFIGGAGAGSGGGAGGGSFIGGTGAAGIGIIEWSE